MLDKRPTFVKIKLNNLIHNLNIIKSLIKPETNILAVVKANAYGHGSIEVVKALYNEGVKQFAVACAYEAEKIFNLKLNCKVISLGKIYKEDINLCKKFNYEITVSSLNDLEELSNLNFPINIHLKVDTGMGRCGIWPEDFLTSLTLIKDNKFLNLAGVLTHFPAADTDFKFTNNQIKKLELMKEILREKSFTKTLIHCSNSDAIINFSEACFDIVRPGIILYGSYWNIEKKINLGLKPVMEFISQVVDIKEFNLGNTIGYGRTFKVEKSGHMFALIPAGYADGFCRNFSNKGFVLINNTLCKIAGKISMDWLVVDIDGKNVKIGDKVTFFGDDNLKMDIDKIAKSIDTISYEILCNVGQNYRKEVVYDRSN